MKRKRKMLNRIAIVRYRRTRLASTRRESDARRIAQEVEAAFRCESSFMSARPEWRIAAADFSRKLQSGFFRPRRNVLATS